MLRYVHQHHQAPSRGNQQLSLSPDLLTFLSPGFSSGCWKTQPAPPRAGAGFGSSDLAKSSVKGFGGGPGRLSLHSCASLTALGLLSSTGDEGVSKRARSPSCRGLLHPRLVPRRRPLGPLCLSVGGVPAQGALHGDGGHLAASCPQPQASSHRHLPMPHLQDAHSCRWVPSRQASENRAHRAS